MFIRILQNEDEPSLLNGVNLMDIGGSTYKIFRRKPPTGANSFVFTYIFTKKCPRRRSAPLKRVHAPLRKILDPPLMDI